MTTDPTDTGRKMVPCIYRDGCRQDPMCSMYCCDGAAPTDTVTAGETKTFERALLGVDGNYGFALLGEDLQSGECEFVEIALPLSASKDPRRYHDSEWCRAAQTAASLAYVQLTLRLGRKFAYALDRSHPRYA